MRTIATGWYIAPRPIPLYTGAITSPTLIPNTAIATGGRFFYNGVHSPNWYQVQNAAGKTFFINVDSISGATYVPYANKPSATHADDGTTAPAALTLAKPAAPISVVSIVFSSFGLAAGLYFAHRKQCKPLGYVGYGVLGAISFGIVGEIGVKVFQK